MVNKVVTKVKTLYNYENKLLKSISFIKFKFWAVFVGVLGVSLITLGLYVPHGVSFCVGVILCFISLLLGSDFIDRCEKGMDK